MSFENKIARIMRNTGPARFFVPVGLILIVFGVLTLRSESGSVDAVSMLMLAAGIAAVVFGTLKTVRAFRESGKLDAAVPNGGAFPTEAFEGFKNLPEVTEYYFRFDGNSLKPGYILEDADKQPVFEGKMLKNALVGTRSFVFRDHSTGSARTHEVGHTVTTRMNDEFFSVRSSFKLDGKDIWDVLHGRGLRLATDLHSSFPYMVYYFAQNGAPFARVETSSVYVHEEDEAQHRLAIPSGRMYYRVWTNTRDYESLFLTIFAISETEQAVVE